MTPNITLSLMVTNAEELATMLALLRNADQHDTDLVKEARAERDEATSEAIGWRKAAEEAQNRFIEAANQITELSQHAESLAQQLEASQQSVKIAKDVANDLSHRLGQAREERDQLSELLAKANEQLDGGKNQRIGKHEHPGAGHITERARLLGTVADIHPDEDPRDHPDPEQCRATLREELPKIMGNAHWSVTYCGLPLGHAGQHDGGPNNARRQWNGYNLTRPFDHARAEYESRAHD